MRRKPPDHHRAATEVPRNSGHPLDVCPGHPVPQTAIADPEILSDLRHRLLPQPSKLDGTLTELRWMWARHQDSFPRWCHHLSAGVRQTGGCLTVGRLTTAPVDPLVRCYLGGRLLPAGGADAEDRQLGLGCRVVGRLPPLDVAGADVGRDCDPCGGVTAERRGRSLTTPSSTRSDLPCPVLNSQSLTTPSRSVT
jgi:hypothetical protein